MVRANTAPTFNPTPIVDRVFNVGAAIAFSIAVVDAEADTTTTTVPNPPAFLSWTTPNFVNILTTTAADAGTHDIAMKVCDVPWNACTETSLHVIINQLPYVNAAIPNT